MEKFNVSNGEPNRVEFDQSVYGSYRKQSFFMKIAQRKIKWISRLMLVAAFFAQGTLAAHACVMSASSAVQPVAVEAMPCHGAAQHNANACLMHCTQSDQVNLDQQHFAVVSFDDVVLHIALPSLQHRVFAVDHPPLVLDTGPPLSIRYCTFLI